MKGYALMITYNLSITMKWQCLDSFFRFKQFFIDYFQYLNSKIYYTLMTFSFLMNGSFINSVLYFFLNLYTYYLFLSNILHLSSINRFFDIVFF